MSDYARAFAISASGMSLERLRLEVAGINLANAHATQGLNGRPFVPLRVVANPAISFDSVLTGRTDALALRGVGSVEVQSVDAVPKLEYDPGNPNADERGFVAQSALNPVEEMISVLSSVRAYEANARAFEAAKTMALKALSMGDSR